MDAQHLYSYTRRAIDDFKMINDGDKIAVGISGGKDSLALLYALKGLQRFYPNRFELEAITVDLGFGIQNFDKIKSYCDEFNVPYTVIKTDIAEIIFNERKESSPCSLCAKMRKGSLNEIAKEHGCNKVAYAHHKDDVIETMFLSLIYEGRFHCFSPVTHLDRIGLTLIRPMIYVQERDVVGFAKKYELPVAKSGCPVDGYTKRQYVKDLIKQFEKENKGCKDRFFRAVMDGNIFKTSV